MKALKLILPSVLLLLLASSLVAQDITKEKTKVTTKVLLENNQVRVLQIESPVGEVTGLHSHPDYVMYPLTDGKLEETIDGKTRITEFKAGVPQFMKAVTHTAKNVGSTPMKMIIVELKNGSSSSAK
jgi:quercetin dioxygenase-like cupin family protein